MDTYDDYDDFTVANSKGRKGGGTKPKVTKGQTCYSQKHVRAQMVKVEKKRT